MENGFKVSFFGSLLKISFGFLIILRHNIARAIVEPQMIETIGIILLGQLLPMGEIFFQIFVCLDADAILHQDVGCIWQSIDNGLKLWRTDNVGLWHMKLIKQLLFLFNSFGHKPIQII